MPLGPFITFNLPSCIGNALAGHIKGTQISLWWFNRSQQYKDRWPDHLRDFKSTAKPVNDICLLASFEAWFLALAGKYDLKAYTQGSLEAQPQGSCGCLSKFRSDKNGLCLILFWGVGWGVSWCERVNQLKLKESVNADVSNLPVEFSKWKEACFRGRCLIGVWSLTQLLHIKRKVNMPTINFSWWLYTTNQGSLLVSALALSTEVYKGWIKLERSLWSWWKIIYDEIEIKNSPRQLILI